MKSCVLILPLAQVATGDAVGEALGYGPHNYSVALTNATDVTHYGLHTWASDDFQAMIEERVYPPELAEAGISEADYNAMLDVLISSFWPDYVGHFDTVCDENGLKVVEADLEAE